MKFLDKTGLTTLWSKIKDLMSKYLPLTGGAIYGDVTIDGTLNAKDINLIKGVHLYKLDFDKCVELGIFAVSGSTN